MAKGLLTTVFLADLLDSIFLVCKTIEPLHNLGERVHPKRSNKTSFSSNILRKDIPAGLNKNLLYHIIGYDGRSLPKSGT